ncbi:MULTISPECIES: PepSY domain-containing protein [Ensifer]|uniref:PepSY domain-containing protein n=1 Tax=Ensifer TaxID=106591 RepID=UPI001CBAF96A|nr:MULTISPECIES: PepSY domain-containing protein [Ensifer]
MSSAMGYRCAMCSFRILSVFALLLLGLPLLPGPARADDDRSHAAGDDDVPSHDDLSELVREGRIHPLAVLKAQVLTKLPGELIDVRVERDDGVIIYEFRILRESGRVTEVEVEAASGRIVEIENE